MLPVNSDLYSSTAVLREAEKSDVSDQVGEVIASVESNRK